MMARRLFFSRIKVAVGFFMFAAFTYLECADTALRIATYTQPKRYFCGPTSLYLVLDYWGVCNIEYSRLVKRAFDGKRKLTTNSSMVSVPRDYGFETYSFKGNISVLEKLVKKKIPVIVLQNYSDTYKMGHFRIVLGVDRQKECVYLKDPSCRKSIKMKIKKFNRLWEMGEGINQSKWAMVVVPNFIGVSIPEVKSSPITSINVGTYLYRAKKYGEAVRMYNTAYSKMQDNVFVMLYYSQALLRIGKNNEASEIAKKIIRIDPENPLAFDILGLTHFLNKKYKESLLHFAKAIKLNRGKNENAFLYYHYQKAVEKTKQVEGR